MQKSSWISHGSTSLFVLLWSSGAITAKLSLLYATPFAFLLMRLGLAFTVLCLLAARRGRFLPAPGSRITTIGIGLLILGGYTVCYLLALAHGVAPGVLATVLGIQPILTLLWTERRFHGRRLAGLALALAGLVLVVWQGIHLEGLGWLGMAFALGSLLCMTAGAIMQKRSAQAPLDVIAAAVRGQPRAMPADRALAAAGPDPWLAAAGASALAGPGHLRGRHPALLSPDPGRRPGQCDQPLLPGARRHGLAGLPAAGQSAAAAGPGWHGRHPRRPGPGHGGPKR